MRYRTLTTALTAAALVFVPTSAIAQRAPLPAQTEEAGMQLKDREGRPRGLLLWLFLGAAVAAVVLYLLLHDKNNNDLPTSP